YKYPASEAAIRSLSTEKAKVERVTLVGKQPRPVKFRQTSDALLCTLPAQTTKSDLPYTLRIEGTLPVGLNQSSS
ncbi:MAG TPA: hypothetical protein VK593_00635, partial [Edaphobacter sp.]|nr:hypothetical protein [Edaphobacter sp.]